MTEMNLNQIRLDALREISSIATGNAATSLSSLLDRKVNITIPNVLIEPLKAIPDLLGGDEKAATVIYFSITGQISGSILLVFSPSDSLRLAELLTGLKANRIEDLSEMGISALKELGNIITGSYVRVLAHGLKVKMTYTVPGFAYDMIGAILDNMLARLALKAENAVVMESELTVRKELFHGHLILIMAPKAINTIIKALGMWNK